MIVEKRICASISAMLLTRMKISMPPLSQVPILQCHCENARMMALSSMKSPTITIHLMILFD